MTTKTKPKEETKPLEKVREIKLEDLLPNPYQPETRVAVDPETAKKFALSIQEHGLIQTPVVRPGKEDGKYEVGDGWLRRAGYLFNLKEFGLPGYAAMPCLVKEMTDRQMADIVMEANTVRKDLNPIELAQFYKRYLEDFKMPQAELARKHNCSQGEIANTLRLLELPADIQQKIISQEITETHGRQLLRLNKVPELQQKIANDCIQRHLSVGELSNQIEGNLWHKSKSLNPGADRWDKPVFDVSECKDCEHKIKAFEPYGSQKKEARCLNEECWEQKNAAAVQEQVKEAKEALKEQGTTEKFVTADVVSYDQRETIRPDDIDTPGECKKCPKAALFKYRATDSGKPERICLDPACYRKKKTKKTRDTNKIKKEQDQQLTEELGKFFQGVASNPAGCLRVIAKHVLPQLSADGKRDLCKVFEVPTLSNGQLDLNVLRIELKEKSLDELLKISVAAVMISSRRGEYTASGYSTKLTQELEKDQAIILGNLDDFIAGVTAFQEANCRGCRQSIARLIGTGEECCNFIYNKKINAEGKCTGRILDATMQQPDDEQDLLSFQTKNCTGCHWADQDKVCSGKPCCTFITSPHIVDGNCLTRKVQDETGDQDPLAELLIQTATDGQKEHRMQLGDIDVRGETLKDRGYP